MHGGVSTDSADSVPPFFFSGITTDETTRANLAYLTPPKQVCVRVRGSETGDAQAHHLAGPCHLPHPPLLFPLPSNTSG